MTKTTRRLRLEINVLLGLASLGIGAELVLMEHDEGWRQALPIWTLAAGLAALLWSQLSDSSMTRLVMRASMLGLLACGVAGVYFHYVSNEEFQRELNPELDRWGLILATMRSHSPPSLAPAAMLLLGALGWIGTSGPRDRDDG